MLLSSWGLSSGWCMYQSGTWGWRGEIRSLRDKSNSLKYHSLNNLTLVGYNHQYTVIRLQPLPPPWFNSTLIKLPLGNDCSVYLNHGLGHGLPWNILPSEVLGHADLPQLGLMQCNLLKVLTTDFCKLLSLPDLNKIGFIIPPWASQILVPHNILKEFKSHLRYLLLASSEKLLRSTIRVFRLSLFTGAQFGIITAGSFRYFHQNWLKIFRILKTIMDQITRYIIRWR